MVSKGTVPQTKLEHRTIVESHNATLINPSNFPKTMVRSAYPIVIVYNGRDHFVPTKPSTNREFYKWKLEKQLGPILSAGLLVICELDRSLLDNTLQNSVSEVEACIVKHLPILSPEANEAHHVDVVVAPQRGPCFEHQPAGPLISAPDTPPVLPSSSTASTDVPGGQGPASQPGKKPRKSYNAIPHLARKTIFLQSQHSSSTCS